jgi:hypothetical protein
MYDFTVHVRNNILTLVISLSDTPIRRLVTSNSCYESCIHVTFPDFLLSWVLRTGLMYAEAYLFSGLIFIWTYLQTCDRRILMYNYILCCVDLWSLECFQNGDTLLGTTGIAPPSFGSQDEAASDYGVRRVSIGMHCNTKSGNESQLWEPCALLKRG